MKKLLSIVLALTLVLGMFPVFAAPEFAENTGAKNLKHYGFISGGTNGDLMEANKLTRQELAVILAQLHGKNDEAKVYATPSGFADEASFPAWAKGYISFAKKEGWLKGNDKNMFNNNDVVSDAELAVVIIRALGYPELNWGQHINFLNDKGISISGNQLSRADAFEAIWLAVSSPVAKDNKILGVELGKLDANLFEPQVKNLAINSVSANNLKEIIVAFNQPVNKDELGKFSLDNKVKIAEKSLSEDATVVTLTVEGTLKQGKEYTLTVKDTAAVAEKAGKLAEVSEKVTPHDTMIPEVTAVEFSGPKLITVTFSEPMKEGKIKDLSGVFTITPGKGSMSINKADSEVKGNKAFIYLYGSVQAEKEYTVFINKFEDESGLINKFYEEKLSVAKDDEKPTAKIVEATETYYIVEFSEPVKGIDKSDFHHTYNKINAKKIYFVPNKLDSAKNPIEVKDTDVVTKIKVVFYVADGDNALANGDVKILVDGGRIKDSWGNKLDDFTASATVASDLERPEVKSVEAGDNYIKVTFTEEVIHRISKSDSFTATDKNGKNVFKDVEYDEKVAKVILKGSVKANDKIKITIKNIKDLSVNENRMAETYTEELTLVDKKGPEVVNNQATYYKDGTVYQLFVRFDEPVDSATALNVKNYKLIKSDSTVVELTKDPEFYEGNADVIMIPMTKKQYDAAATALTKLFVQNVMDLNTNVMNTNANVQLAEHGATLKVGLIATDPVKAIDARTVTIKFNQNLTNVDASKFKFDGVGYKITDLDWEADTVTVKCDVDLPANPNAVKIDILADAVRGVFSQGASGYFTAVDDQALVDGIAPAVEKSADGKYIIKQGKDAEKNQIVLTANENLKKLTDAVQSRMSHDIKVFYNDVELTLEDDAIEFEDPNNSTSIKINIKKVVVDDKLVEYSDPTVNQEGTVKVVIKDAKYVTDLKDNAIEDCTASVKLDLKKPAKFTFKSISEDKKVLVFTASEALYDDATTLINGADVDVKADLTSDCTDWSEAETTAKYNANTKELTITLKTAIETGKKISVAADKFKDQFGNAMDAAEIYIQP